MIFSAFFRAHDALLIILSGVIFLGVEASMYPECTNKVLIGIIWKKELYFHTRVKLSLVDGIARTIISLIFILVHVQNCWVICLSGTTPQHSCQALTSFNQFPSKAFQCAPR